MVVLTVRRRGVEVSTFSTVAVPTDPRELHQLLAGAVARAGDEPEHIGEYEMDVRRVGAADLLLTFVASSRTA